MTKNTTPTRKKIADEIEGWATGAFAAGRRPDILSATEAVADYWQEIVAALRENETVMQATELGSDPPKNQWQRGWNAAMNHVRDACGLPLKRT
ncbi:MAG TPA: hypothetical protein VFN49_03660 [Candidatus Aquilonibacter sp.]|nr:hypothetical protein [Candidatus Aquilonibacter sp.]